jgi:anaerobic selenocysteine-containing dehydrogenase
MAHRIVEQAPTMRNSAKTMYAVSGISGAPGERYTPQWAEGITGISAETIIELADDLPNQTSRDGRPQESIVNFEWHQAESHLLPNAITGNVDGQAV